MELWAPHPLWPRNALQERWEKIEIDTGISNAFLQQNRILPQNVLHWSWAQWIEKKREIQVIYHELVCFKMMRPFGSMIYVFYGLDTSLILGAWNYSNETWPTRSWTWTPWLCHLARKLRSHQKLDRNQYRTSLNCYLLKYAGLNKYIGLCPNRLCWGSPWPLGWRRASCLSLQGWPPERLKVHPVLNQ